VACSEFSFAEIRAIRAACGGTVNDVVLTVLSGALGRYLELHGESTEGRSMRILAPVNVGVRTRALSAIASRCC
jgi:hypothetical protein